MELPSSNKFENHPRIIPEKFGKIPLSSLGDVVKSILLTDGCMNDNRH